MSNECYVTAGYAPIKHGNVHLKPAERRLVNRDDALLFGAHGWIVECSDETVPIREPRVVDPVTVIPRDLTSETSNK